MSDPEPTDRMRIAWLLDFLRCELEQLRFGELIDLQDEAIRFRDGPQLQRTLEEVIAQSKAGFEEWYERKFDPPITLLGTRDEIETDARKRLEGLQDRLRAGLASIEAADAWPLFHKGGAPQWIVEPRPDGTLERRFAGDLPEVFLAFAAAILVRWWPQLQKCAHDLCGTRFLPHHGRQRYHEPACRQAAYRARNQRDYSAEHEQRVRRVSGNPNLQTQKRDKTQATER